MNIELTLLTNKLPDVNHHFSILIHKQGTYYELKPGYHRQYPSTVTYRQWWEFRYRRVSLASDAIQARAFSVLRRSKVKPHNFKYMTTMILSQNRMRHVCAVELRGADFAKLWNMGVLRELHRPTEKKSKGEEIRQMLYGLIPFTLLNLQKVA